ncbi:LOW QUALITY PROTEIN: Reverse transcriptase [Phytophthora palmivora]|uniref:Reverse transcriptase n=1 Tax=Phytophthora palmivora TaxID=4796 RepID=A0A2P4WXN5_9STRA|nr:LOW QUALITY PROTEIN: Reverse transcriptase [Phytophthora palmivora]
MPRLRSGEELYCGCGVSVARQYYHARKRSDESPLEFLHRLNVAGMRAKLLIKDGPGATRRERVEHFIETLDDRELADQLALLRLTDAEVLEETLRARQRAKARQGKAHAGSNKFRQKVGPAPQSAPSKTARAREAANRSRSPADQSLKTNIDKCIWQPQPIANNEATYDPLTKVTTVPPNDRHDDLGCWKRLTCQKCGRKGHPSDHCLFVCRACGEIHDAGKCPMEEFYNLIRKWNAASRCGEDVKLERSPGWNLVRAERSELCIFAYVEKQMKPKDEYSRSEVVMELDLLPGESRGYWKFHTPGKWFKQAKDTGKINNEKATLLFDSGAEVSIVDSTFARKVGCYIDDSQKQECVGIGKNAYMTEGRTKIKVTLAGSLVHYFDVWVGALSGQESILSMDFMVPAGIRLDLADRSLCLLDEVRIQLAGRRQLFSANPRRLELGQDFEVAVGGSIDIPIYSRASDRQKLWITRGERWVPTYVKGLGRRKYLRVTNLSDKPLTLFDDTWLGIWLNGDHVPHQPGSVLFGTRRYNEWQNLAYEASTDKPEKEEYVDLPTRPMVSSQHTTLQRRSWPDELNNRRSLPRERRPTKMPAKTEGSPKLGIPDTRAQEAEQVCYHEGGDLLAEDFEDHMAVVPEVIATTEEVTLDDIQVGDPDVNSPEEIERLRHIIWKKAHLLIGEGNALPPAALGAICDIDVGDATPIAQRCRSVAPQFREKLSALIKGLLSAMIITHSTSPWASPIVIITKKNGVEIRLCIDYRLVNSLTKLMVYPIPLISDLLEDLDKVLWYCSLDMASGFWIVSMTERARKISAFITPFGLFEWTRMPFGLKNAPQIYQSLFDNALYGHLRITPGRDQSETIDVFTEGEPESEAKPSVLGRQLYIDDILVTAMSWDDLCQRVKRLLDACDRWNLSISVAKSFWGLRKVAYLGHRVSVEGLEADPKDLDLKSSASTDAAIDAIFLGSLNYYSRFIEDFAVYAAILCELREADFHEIRKDKKTGDSDVGTGGDRAPEDQRDRWAKAQTAFTLLKSKIVSTPVLRHFDQDRTPVIVLYANKWAISAALIQEHDGVYWPVTFTSRTLKPNEINNGIVDKEVLALLRILDVCYTQLVTRPIKVLSRHSTLAWLLNSPGFDGRLGKWAALLSGWTLEITKCSKGEEEILGAIAASITPRAEVDEALIAIAPKKQPRQTITMSLPTVESNESLLVLSFDGSARVKRNGGHTAP